MRLRPTFLLAASSDVVDDNDMSRFSWPSLALLRLHSIRRRLSLSVRQATTNKRPWERGNTAFDGRRPPT